MNFLPRVPSSSKKSRFSSATSGAEKPEIDRLRKSIAEREVKILQDISNLSHKRASFTQAKRHSNPPSLKYDESEMDLAEPIFENADANCELEADIRSNVKVAVDDLDEESRATASLEYFGHPDIRVTSRDLQRAKGNLWVKHWSKDPLPRNSLPDHFQ